MIHIFRRCNSNNKYLLDNIARIKIWNLSGVRTTIWILRTMSATVYNAVYCWLVYEKTSDILVYSTISARQIPVGLTPDKDTDIINIETNENSYDTNGQQGPWAIDSSGKMPLLSFGGLFSALVVIRDEIEKYRMSVCSCFHA